MSALRVLEAHARAYRRVWKGSAVTTFLSPLLFLLAMGIGLGELVDRGAGTAELPGGIAYLAFLAPGLLAATTMQTAAGDSSWPVMIGLKWRRTYHAAFATPVGARDLVLGHLGWVVVRLVLTALVFVAVMVLFGAVDPVPGLAAVGPALLTGLAFAGPVMAYTTTQDEGYGLANLFRYGIMPMFLFSGTFFPISQLPDVLQPAAVLIPLWHGVELCRAAALGWATAWPVWGHVAYLLAWCLAGAALAVPMLRRRLVR